MRAWPGTRELTCLQTILSRRTSGKECSNPIQPFHNKANFVGAELRCFQTTYKRYLADKERKIGEMVKKSERFIRLEEFTKPRAGKITRNKKGIIPLIILLHWWKWYAIHDDSWLWRKKCTFSPLRAAWLSLKPFERSASRSCEFEDDSALGKLLK